MGARMIGFGRRAGVDDRLGRLGWLCLWLVAKHGMRLWLTAPVYPENSIEPSRGSMIVAE
jgi:hypothetical protein